jgi:F-type H+-transporting ATPase subunit b
MKKPLLALGFALALSLPLLLCAGAASPRLAAAAPHQEPPPSEEGIERGDESHMEGHAHGPRPINWLDFSDKETPPFVALAINFAILVGVYWYFGKKPIAEALVQRRNRIAKEIEEAQRMKKEAEKRAEQYQAKLASLGEELDVTKKALVEAGRGEKERIVKEAEEKAERMQRDALFLLEQEVKQMRQDLARETIELALNAAEDLLRKNITQADHERLADEYLAELTKKHMTKGGAAPRAGGAS